jgi:hypothetical protein
MMMRWTVGLLVVGLWIASATPVAALCVCGDRDGCGSASSCVGKSPGDTCTGTRTCKIRVGTGNDLNCCCGCSPGAGPVGCNYGSVNVAATLAPAVEACGSEPLARAASKAAGKADAKLAKATAACEAEKRSDNKANGAEAQLGKLRKKIDKLAGKGEITGECADALRGLVTELTGEIAAVEEGGGGGGTTSTTTSTTLPGGPSCSAVFTTFDPNEVDFVINCLGGGLYTGFTIQFTGGRTVTNWLEPSGFTCSPTQTASPNDSLLCTGPAVTKAPLSGGRIHTVPPPGSDVPANLFVVPEGGGQLGPFTTTGP